MLDKTAMPANNMFIDTANANSRFAPPRIIITPRTSPYNDSSTPRLEAFVGQNRDEPPSYLEATTPGLYTSRLSGEEGARLLSSDGRESVDARNKEELYNAESLGEGCIRRKWAKIMCALMPLFILISLLVIGIALRNSREESNNTTSSTSLLSTGQSADGTWINPPTNVGQPPKAFESQLAEGFIGDGEATVSEAPHLVAIPWPTPSSASQPPSPLESKQVFPIRWPSRCGKGYNVKTEEWDFGTSKEINIKERIHQLDNSFKRVDGWIHIAQAPATQAAGTVQARLSYAMSDAIDVNSLQYSAAATGLIIGDPSFPDGYEGKRKGKYCLGMSVVLYMAAGTQLENLNIDALHLGMQIHQGADFAVTNMTSISLAAGTLDAAALDSRSTYLQSIAGSISGKYSLRNLLSVKTQSGSVNINIAPRESPDKEVQEPAVFRIDARSASIRADFDTVRIPARDYQTFINTTVGSVDATLIHGSHTEIGSVAGFVTADIVPYSMNANIASELYTNTHAGQLALTLRTPYRAPGVPMTKLLSTHVSTSGGIDVTYPEEWTGVVDGTSANGALHLSGQALELMNENDTPGKNHVEAKKGSGASRMVFDTQDGECVIKVGKEEVKS